MARKNEEKGRLPRAEEFALLLGHMAEVSGVYTVVLDAQGRPVHAPKHKRGQNGGCKHTVTSCEKTLADLFAASQNSEGPTVGRCEEFGHNAVALPIIIDSEHVGTWVLCQFTFQDAAAPPATDNAATSAVPVMNIETLQFLQRLITSLCQPILRLRQTNDELSESSRLTSKLAYTDFMLGLPNRNQLKLDLAQDSSGCLLLLDIRDLAKVNELYNRPTGDELLRVLRDYIVSLAVPNSTLYRLTTAVFGLWVKHSCQEALVPLADEILAHCTKPLHLEVNGAQIDLICKPIVGLLQLADLDSLDIEDVAEASRFVMKQALQTGEVAIFDGEKNKSYRRLLDLEQSFAQDVANSMRGFSVAYQPIVDLASGLWKGVEALCRWESERHGPISPAEFIPIAEANGLIGDMGLWVLDKAVEEVGTLGLCGYEQFVLDVNLSPIQLGDPGLAGKVLEIVRRHSYPLEKLCLEITESSDLDFSGQQLETLFALEKHGITFALDDFGVGYASLSSLYKLPVHIIKTDRSLVQEVDKNIFLQRLFYVMGELAHVNGMKIVAEGVETEAQAEMLLMEGADYFQGYLFSKPLSIDQLRSMKARFTTSSIDRPTVNYPPQGGEEDTDNDPRESYGLPMSLYNMLNRCMQVLFTKPRPDTAINEVLAIVGKELDVSRAYVYMRDQDNQYSLTHNWCAPGVSGFDSDVYTLHPEDLGPDWLREQLREGLYIAADVNTIPGGMRQMLQRHNVKAFAEFALKRNGEPVGTVSFNDCKRVRYWSKEDIRMLQLLANMLGSVLSKSDLLNQLDSQRAELQRILDRIDALVYVTNPETGEILFANQRTRQTFGLDTLEGKKCWSALQGQKEPCAFCPKDRLREKPDEIQHYELYNEPLGDYLQIGASTIQWQNEPNSILFSAVNINELIGRQQWLERTATVDALTGVHNRLSFHENAKQLLYKAHISGKVATLAFIDVDGLKRENDLRGHASGDELLCTIVDHLRKKMRTSDLIGRYGGDEFVALFYACEREHVVRKLDRVLAGLAQLNNPVIGRYFSFSYGLADTKEHAYRVGDEYLKEMIETADGRMFAYKQTVHAGGRTSDEESNDTSIG